MALKSKQKQQENELLISRGSNQAAEASNTCSTHKCMRANTVLGGFEHPVQVSFAPPSWDVPDLHRALPLPSSVNLVYLNVFCAAAAAAEAAVQFWG